MSVCIASRGRQGFVCKLLHHTADINVCLYISHLMILYIIHTVFNSRNLARFSIHLFTAERDEGLHVPSIVMRLSVVLTLDAP